MKFRCAAGHVPCGCEGNYEPHHFAIQNTTGTTRRMGWRLLENRREREASAGMGTGMRGLQRGVGLGVAGEDRTELAGKWTLVWVPQVLGVQG